MSKELINTTASTLQQFNSFEFIDQYNPDEAINALRENEDFAESSDKEAWFATAKVNGVKVAMYGEGTMTSPCTPIQYLEL